MIDRSFNLGRAIVCHERELELRMERIDQEVADQVNELEGRLDAALGEQDSEEETEVVELDERINQESSEAISQAQNLQIWIQSHLGQAAEEDMNLKWAGTESGQVVIQAGEIISNDHEILINDLVQQKLNDLQTESDEEKADIRLLISAKREHIRNDLGAQLDELRNDIAARKDQLRVQMEASLEDLKALEEKTLLTETRYRELADSWGNVFNGGMGAEAIRDIVAKEDLELLTKELRKEIRTTRSKQRRKKAAKRLRVVENFRKSGNRPEWMVLTSLPVIPPDLRPMVQLDGGRFATSDLNDLYRRVINRNNRLHRLMELGAPDVIVRNEKRMLQEAVDSLVDNGRRGRAVSRSGKRKLKSLSDMLKGKQGRFRRNLLGKRVDYSGRSVIVIGPTLKLHQCGLPKKMALELFKPFVMRQLVDYNYAHNIKSAKRMVDRQSPEVWDVLEEICNDRPVLLNRAPTLHRLGIQAFEVILVEGSAIQLHPLTCGAFNADFDGDQMAVHVPLSKEAVKEARELMLSSQNLLKPSSGEPIVGPSKDMVMGVYYLTVEEATVDNGQLTVNSANNQQPATSDQLPTFGSIEEAEYLYSVGQLRLREPIWVRYLSKYDSVPITELTLSERVMETLVNYGIETVAQIMDLRTLGENKMIREIPGFGAAAMTEVQEALRLLGLLGATWPATNHQQPTTNTSARMVRTTVGRIIFNGILPSELHFVNEPLDRKGVDSIVDRCYKHLGREVTAELVDNIKDIGFEYATRSGITIAVSDIKVPDQKAAILEATTQDVQQLEQQFRRGLITSEEQYNRTVELWTRATDDVTEEVKKLLSDIEGLGAMAKSGASKGGINPIRQLAGMRGMMAGPSGRIIPLPIRSNFREGLSALEYFLSTHGARKGLADTTLRTADAGYLTRRLVDVAQDVIISEDDCETTSGIWITKAEAEEMGQTIQDRVDGRFLIGEVSDPETGDILLESGAFMDEAALATIGRYDIQLLYVRNPLTCECRFGICKKCYGQDLARGGDISMGEAVGIIAAQSIGEPGTQLTLRTFHTGGVAGSDDITQGLPRIEELFEARNPKGEAVISEIDGTIDIYWEGEIRMIKVSRTELLRHQITVPPSHEILIADGDRVQEDTVVAEIVDSGQLTVDSEETSNQQPTTSNQLAGMDGEIFIENQPDGTTTLTVRREDTHIWEAEIPANARLRIEKGDTVMAGDQLTEGAKNPKEILRIQGREACQLYLLGEVQRVYRSQGVGIHDKHIEVVLRQLLRRIMVRATGDTDLLPGELIDRFNFEDINNAIVSRGGKPARGEPVVLGLTKAALNTESFLAAASFQETTRVLTEAAIRGQRDELRGLKENVIIGKLIPVGTGFHARRSAKWNPVQEEIKFEFDQTIADHPLDSVDEFMGMDLPDIEFDGELELGDLDFSDLDMTGMGGVAELGMEPMTISSDSHSEDEGSKEMNIDFNSLKTDETDEIDLEVE